MKGRNIKSVIVFLLMIIANYSKGQTYLTEDFESTFTGSPATPPGWSQNTILLTGVGTPAANQVNGPKDWQRNTFSGSVWSFLPSSSTSVPPGAQSGTSCLYIQDSYFGSSSISFGARRIESPVIDLSASVSSSPYIRFWYNYGFTESNSANVLRVMGSSDGGITWKILMQVASNSSLSWQRINVLIPTTFRTSSFKVGFEITSLRGSFDYFIDNLSIEEFTPTTITSLASGNWSSVAMWPGGIIPNCDNNVVIAVGHTVGADMSLVRCQNLTVNGIMQYASSSSFQNIQIFGDLNVTSGATYNSFFSSTGKATFLGGSLINNGTINFSVGNATLWWYGGKPATYSGAGSITTFISSIRHANSGGVTYNSPLQVRGTVGLYDGTVNPNGNLTVGNSAVSTQTIEVAHGSFTASPIWGTGVTRSNSYVDGMIGSVSCTPQIIIAGEEIENISGARTIGGNLSMNTYGNLQLNYPLTIGSGTSGFLSLSRGIIINNTTNVLTINNTNSTGSSAGYPNTSSPPNYHGSYVTGAIKINFGTTTSQRSFPLGKGTAFNNTGDGAVPSSNFGRTVEIFTSTAWTAGTAVTVSIESGLPTGTLNSPITGLMGKILYRINTNSGPELPTSAGIRLGGSNYIYGDSLNYDSLYSDYSTYGIAQSTTGTGNWALRTSLSGSGNFLINSEYSVYSSSSAPGPIVPFSTNGHYFTLATTAVNCNVPANPGNTISSLSIACTGTSFTLNIQNSIPDAGISFQWQSSPDSSTWTNISNATQYRHITSLSISSLYFRCAVTCSYSGLTNYSPGKLVVLGCQSLNGGTTNVSTSTICTTTNFTLSLSGATTSCIAYQWQSSPDSAAWSDISGAISSTLVTNQSSTTFYRCKITCTSGGTIVFSIPRKVTMTCASLVGGTTTSTATTVCSSSSFTVSISGQTTSCVTYQWQSSPDSVMWTNIAGATSTSTVRTQTALTFYRCQVSCDAGAVIAHSLPVKVRMICSAINGVSILTTSFTVCPDGYFTLLLIGNPVGSCISYQWQSSPDNITFTDYVSGTSSITINQTLPHYYRCVLNCESGNTIYASSSIYILMEQNCGEWKQKRNFPGTPRNGGVSFSIGTKTYFGTGEDNTFTRRNDLWEYDAANNVWTQKANFGGTARTFAAAFSIGAKGYVGTGFIGSGGTNDFWEYDTTSNLWTQKANFAGSSRQLATGFSIGAKGYISNGLAGASNTADLWEYDPSLNSWVQKATNTGQNRSSAVAFVIGTKAYVGLGTATSAPTFRSDFFQYDQATNTWTTRASMPGIGRKSAVAFTLGGIGFVGSGSGNASNTNLYKDFFEYDPVANTWKQSAGLNGSPRYAATGFAIGSKGYVVAGSSSTGKLADLWEFQKSANCMGTPDPGNTVASVSAVCPGSSFTLSLQNPIAGLQVAYQWQKSTDNLNYSNTSGIVSFHITSQTVPTWYRCIVTCAGSTADTSGNLLINMVCESGMLPAGLITNTNTFSTCPGSPVTLEVSGPNLNCVSYQWEKSTDNEGSYSIVPNATSPFLSTTLSSTTFFRCKVTCNSNNSLFVYSISTRVYNICEIAPGSLSISSESSVCPADSFQLSTNISPSACMTFQWQKSNDNIIYSNISGATSSIYKTALSTETFYRCYVSCDAGITSVNAEPVYVSLEQNCTDSICSGTPPTATIITSVNPVCAGNNFILTLQNYPVIDSILFQWQESVDGTNFSDIGGAVSRSVTLSQAASKYYKCKFYCSLSSMESFSPSLLVNTLGSPSLTVTQSTHMVCPPGSPVTITASGSASYTWYPSSSLNYSTGSSVIYKPSASSVLTLTGTGLNGCKSELPVNVSVCPAVNSQGKDFWLMFNSNYDYAADTLALFISSEVNTSGIVSGPLFNSIPFTVNANQVTRVVVDIGLSMHTSDVIDQFGIHVTASQYITVYGLNRMQASTDAYLGLPTHALGNNYMVMSYKSPGTGTLNPTEFGIVAAYNGTAVTITPSVTTGSRIAGIPYTIYLDQGDSYELRNNSGTSADFTGTLISSTQAVGVFGAVRCAQVPLGFTACDHICEMMPPLNTWGKTFGVVPLKSRLNGDTFRFLAAEDNTTININGTPQSAINKGNYIETILTAQSLIESDKPILVAQYANGSQFSGPPGDPFMMLIPSLEQFLSNYTVTTVSGFTTDYINLVVPNSDTGNVILDGTLISSSEFTPIGSSGYSGAAIQVSPGTHSLSCPLPFGAFQYGFGSFDSYGYPGGQSFSAVATVNSLALTPANGTNFINVNNCWQALVKDQYGLPLQGIRVDFTSAGSNVNTGFSYTNASGVASYCYTGDSTGTDTIIASVGSYIDTSFFSWVQGSGMTLNVKLYVEGFYQGNGLMIPALLSDGSSTSLVNCDYILVELHDENDYSIVRSDSAMLKVNGDASIIYPSSLSGSSYYIVVRHRNAVETWSKNPILFNGSVVNYDLRQY